MKNLLIQVGTEILQNPKTSQMILGVGGAFGAGTVMEWLPAIVGLIASIIAVLVSISIFVFNFRKDKRETIEHNQKMREIRTRRSTDSKLKKM